MRYITIIDVFGTYYIHFIVSLRTGHGPSPSIINWKLLYTVLHFIVSLKTGHGLSSSIIN